MAKIIFGGGMSHTPLLTMQAADWRERGLADMKNKALNLSDGRFVSYEELNAEVNGKYETDATYEVFHQKAVICQAALDRFKKDLAAAKPDVVVIVSNDHYDLFGPENIPSVAVFYGEKIVMHADPNFETHPRWMQDIQIGYAQDKRHVFTGHRALALDVINGLVDQDIDIAISSEVSDTGHKGFGHGYGFVIRRVLSSVNIPVVPILLNTYYPPNVPSADRCFTIGQALKKAIEGSNLDLRVAVVASGGLSHFVVDEVLDRNVLNSFMADDSEALRGIPRAALNSGSSEILNWVLVSAAISTLTPRWSEYQPIHRTPAGTGVGVGLGARW